MKKIIFKVFGVYQIICFMIGLMFIGVRLAPFYYQMGQLQPTFTDFLPVIFLLLLNLLVVASGILIFYQTKLGVILTLVNQFLQSFFIITKSFYYFTFSGFIWGILNQNANGAKLSKFFTQFGAKMDIFINPDVGNVFAFGFNFVAIFIFIVVLGIALKKKSYIDDGAIKFENLLSENKVENNDYLLNGINYHFIYLGNNIVQVRIDDELLSENKKLKEFLQESYRNVQDGVSFFIMLEIRQLEKFFYSLREQTI